MDDIADASAAGLARRVREGALSPVAVVEATLDRIRARNDRTNAFVTVDEEGALAAAREAERALAAGDPPGPLCGVPVAVKDLTDVAGLPTTRGSLLFEDRVPERSHPVVERLTDAGAVVVGKTNTPEFGIGVTTDNRVAGPTGTPFAPDRTAGGSSGGSGAALGDRLVPLAQGTDAGGSIRVPAAFCGVFGHKPTYGLVPNPSRPDAFATHTPFVHQGPMARRVEDAALALDAMAGRHPRDPFSLRAGDGHLSAVDRPVDDLRIAYSPGLGTYPVAPAVRDVLDDAVRTFERAGATVERVDPEFGRDRHEILDAFYTFARVAWGALFDALERQGLDPRGDDRDRLRPYVREMVLDAERPGTRELKRADVVRTDVYDGLVDRFESHDLLVSATTATPPFPHDEEPTTVAGEEVERYRGWVLTQPYNFTGQPAASVPAGTTDEGLPVGLQVAGPRFADGDVLAASAALERRRPWHDAYPS
ncbi:MAG: amidase [Haloferacaceae archaeon]